jgi:hypothetical protein
MAYRHKVIRCTAFGTCYGGAEEWSTGFFMGYADQDALAPTQASADYFLTHWQAFFQNINTGITNKYQTHGVRTALLNTDGKTDLTANFYAYPTVPFLGTGGSGSPPPQLTLVASLQARPDAGLGAKGRMFLPGVDKPLATGAYISSSETAEIAATLKTMFDAMNASTDIVGNVINASRGRGLGIGGDMPVNRNVEDVLIGNVYDTQRRRRNQLQEQYSTASLVLS